MMKLADWFAKERYHGKYQLGDRVEGKYKKVPFVGSVGTDSVRFDGEEPHVTVTLDLPMKIGSDVHNVLRVPTKSVSLRSISEK
jgi:hypothetical protein